MKGGAAARSPASRLPGRGAPARPLDSPRSFMPYLIIAAVGVSLALNRSGIQVSDAVAARGSKELAAAAGLAGLFLAALAGLVAAQSRRTPGVASRYRNRLILWSLAWSAAVCVSAAIGMARGNQLGFLLGDVFKFLLLPLWLVIALLCLRTLADVRTVLLGLLVVVAALVLADGFLYRSQTEAGARLTTSATYFMTALHPVWIYLLIRKESPGTKALVVACAGAFVGAALLVQGLTDYVFIAIAMFLFAIYWRRWRLLGGMVLASVLGYVGIWMDPFGIFKSTGGAYALVKAQSALASHGWLQAGVQLGGVRVPQIISSADAVLRGSWVVLLFGTGMGGLSVARPAWAVALGLPPAPPQHFMESAIAEVLYRSGLAGLALFVMLLIALYRLAGKVRRAKYASEYGVFAQVTLIYLVAGLLLAMPMENVWPLLAVIAAGSLAAFEGNELAREQETRRLAAARWAERPGPTRRKLAPAG